MADDIQGLPQGAIMQKMMQDPRYRGLLQALQSGSSTAPVQSPLEGLARALQGGLGAWGVGRLQSQYADRQRAADEGLVKALQGGGDVTQSLLDAAKLNPDLAPTAADYARRMAMKKADNDLALDKDFAGKYMRRVPNPDGSYSLVPIQGGAENEAAAAALKAEREGRVKKGLDLEYDPQIAGATESAKNPALIARAGGEANARNASDLQYAQPKAYATETGRNIAELRDVTINGPNGPLTMPASQARAYATTAGANAANLQQAPEAPPPGQRTVAQALSEAREKPNDTQRVAANYFERALTGDDLVRKFEDINQGPSGTAAAAAAAIPWVGNQLSSSDRQQFEAGKRAFIEAKLRKESGAAISQSEYDSNDRIFFPQPGDSQAVIDQKRGMRQQILEGLKREAAGALKEQPSVPRGGGAGNAPDPLGIR